MDETRITELKKKLSTAQALIKLMEDLFSKARPKMNEKEIRKTEKFMKELKKEESLLMDAFFRAGGK